MVLKLELLRAIGCAEDGDPSLLGDYIQTHSLSVADRALVADYIRGRRRGRPARDPLLRWPTRLDVAERYFRRISPYLARRRGKRLYKTAKGDPRTDLITKVAIKWHVTPEQLAHRLEKGRNAPKSIRR